jgi:hypothetical protein
LVIPPVYFSKIWQTQHLGYISAQPQPEKK